MIAGYYLSTTYHSGLAVLEGNASGRNGSSERGIAHMAYKGVLLTTNQALHADDYLETGGGLFVALMQSDGNLVVYPGEQAVHLGPRAERGAVWASGSYSDTQQCVALMQSDGNFVIYPTPDAVGKAPTEQTGAIWATNTSGPGGKFYVILERDGVLAVRSGEPGDPDSRLLWESREPNPFSSLEQ